MQLSLKSLNDDATLNDFRDIGSASFIRGSTMKLILQLIQPELAIRFIPTSTTVITMDLLKSDGTVLSKTATRPFVDDRSIFQIDITATESAALISQTLTAKLTDGSTINFAQLQAGLQMNSTIQDC